MPMQKCKLLFLILLASISTPLLLPAQKELKALKAHVKAGKSAEALKEVERLEKDSVWGKSALVYDLAFQAYNQILTAQNEKMYLRQKADTAAYFGAVKGMFSAAQKCERAECRMQKAGEGKIKFRAPHASILAPLIPNLVAAANYSYHYGKYKEAEEDAQLLLIFNKDSVFWGRIPHPTLDKREVVTASLIHLQSAYCMKHYDRVFRYSATAMERVSARADIMDKLAHAHLFMGDTIAYRDTLLSAIHQYPERTSFFESIEKYYLSQQQYELLLGVARFVLSTDSTRMDARQSEAYTLFALDRHEELLEAAQQILTIDPDDATANYYLGSIYVKRAEEVDVPVRLGNGQNYRSKMSERRGWYSLAREPMERYRAARPEKVRLWGPKLYDIYLNLNMGKEFEEINKILGK